MVCNLGPSDIVHNLDLTSEKKKITKEFYGILIWKIWFSTDTGEQMEQMAKIDQI